MKVVSWNVRRASAKSDVWGHLLEMDPDVALLQEVGALPALVSSRYLELSKTPVTRAGLPQKFKTSILTRLPVLAEIVLQTENAWVREQADFFGGNLVGASLGCEGQAPLHVINVYAPAWPIDRSKWENIDVTSLKLAASPDLWCTEIMWDLLRHTMPPLASHWIVGGDFNSSETFDLGARGDRGNREIIARLADLGLTELLRGQHGRLVPTFKHTRSKHLVHQLDHIYATRGLKERVTSCNVGDEDRIIGCNLSDHLPIIACFAPVDPTFDKMQCDRLKR